MKIDRLLPPGVGSVILDFGSAGQESEFKEFEATACIECVDRLSVRECNGSFVLVASTNNVCQGLLRLQ